MMKSFFGVNVLFLSWFLLLLGGSSTTSNTLVWAISEPTPFTTSIGNGMWWMDSPVMAAAAEHPHRDLMYCSSSNSCSCSHDLPDGCYYTFSNSRCYTTCPGVCNGADLQVGTTAYCMNGLCGLYATCDNGRGCMGECSNVFSEDWSAWCNPVGCSSGSSSGSTRRPSSSSPSRLRYLWVGLGLAAAAFLWKCCQYTVEAYQEEQEAEAAEKANGDEEDGAVEETRHVEEEETGHEEETDMRGI